MTNITPAHTPNVIRETADGSHVYSIDDLMFRDRTLFLTGEITQELALSIIRQLLFLEHEGPGDITVYFASPGGQVYAGLSILDVMRGMRSPIRAVCVGDTCSMAAVLFAACSRREMLPHSRLMIHDPMIMQAGGPALELRDISENLMKMRDQIAAIMAEATGRTKDEILEKTLRDAWFTAEEAVDFGLADAVVTEL